MILPLLVLLASVSASSLETEKPFAITLVDEQTGRGVPLVELRTVHNTVYVSDSNGVIAFHEPGLMRETVFFHIRSHGYEHAKDGFGYRGKALAITPGGSARISLKRLQVAERLYRSTGVGIYAESHLVGIPTPKARPLLEARVAGSDSVVTALFQGKLHWFWGDTLRPSYPLGNFHVPGATSRLPAEGGMDPSQGIDFEYFVDAKGFASETARLPGPGPTWIFGLTTLKEGTRERLFAGYVKVKPPLEIYEKGICEFDPATRTFRRSTIFPLSGVHPEGHPLLFQRDKTPYIYFAHPYPLTRVQAHPEAFQDPSAYESFTCLTKEGTLDRQDGQVRYAWRKQTKPLTPSEQAKLLKAGLLQQQEALLPLRDIESGKAVLAHSGSVSWNALRKRWVMIAVQSFGEGSLLGEVWFAEADTPLGPWLFARKIASHDRYSFYNPRHHPYFDAEGGRVLYFEGTYTQTFSGNPVPTPRYEYNQVMYRVNLGDSRLALPVAFYSHQEKLGPFQDLPKKVPLCPVFYARDREVPGSVAVYRDDRGVLSLTPVDPKRPALFYGLPHGAAEGVPLQEFTHPDGRVRYHTHPEESDGFRRTERVLVRVWANPTKVLLNPE